jgi:hypothetical protein
MKMQYRVQVGSFPIRSAMTLHGARCAVGRLTGVAEIGDWIEVRYQGVLVERGVVTLWGWSEL